MARLYCQITGIALLLVGLVGIVYQAPLLPGLLSVQEPAEVALHLLLGAAATYAGFTGGYGRFALLYAKVLGPVYIVLGLVGFVLPDILGLIHLDLGCNLVHLVLGLWGVWVGYLAARPAEAPATP